AAVCCGVVCDAAGAAERVHPDGQAAAGRSASLGAAADRRLRVRLDRGDVLSLDHLAAAQPGGKRDAAARTEDCGRPAMTAGHFIFIPAVLLIGVVLGWILGSRAARDAYAAELRRREERAKRGR